MKECARCKIKYWAELTLFTYLMYTTSRYLVVTCTQVKLPYRAVYLACDFWGFTFPFASEAETC